jgi:hypothetical protein
MVKAAMEDAALFFRHTALGCFQRRRKYPVLSENWRHEVNDARAFIRYCRAHWLDRPGHGRSADPAEITRAAYALGPRVRLQNAITRPPRDKAIGATPGSDDAGGAA